MAVIAPTTMQGGGQRTAIPTTLTAADTLAYISNSEQIVLLYNPTGGTISVTFRGTDTVAFAVPGTGDITFSATTGICNCLAGEMSLVNLDEMRLFLLSATNTVNVTGGTGVIAYLLNP